MSAWQLKRAHVWRQGRKVTGITDVRYGRYVYGRGYVYSLSREQRLAAQRRRLAQYAVPTRSDRSNWAERVASVSGFFRLLDVHGKAHGRRYARVGPHECGVYLVVDQHGNQDWLDGSLRARIVTRQREDVLSQASRIINRMHREMKKEGNQ
jgi:hypothetical protein